MRYYDSIVAKPALPTCFAGLILIILVYIYGFDMNRLKPESIRDLIQSFGFWGPLVYIVCNAFRPFLLFPAIVLGIAGGLAFGPFWGTVYLVIGTVLGAVLCFYAARLWRSGKGGLALPKWLPAEQLDEQALRHGFRSMLLLRLAPVLPWDVVSFAAGMSKIHFRPYVLATTIGSIPGAIVFCYVGDALPQQISPPALLLLSGVALFALLLPYGKRYQHS